MFFLFCDLEVTSPATKAEPVSASYTTDLEALPPQGVKFANGNVVETAPLRSGADGFVVAQFADCLQTFDLPNMVLLAIGKVGTHPTKAAKLKNAATKKTKKEIKKAAQKAAKKVLKDAKILAKKNREDAKILAASAKAPRKKGRILQCRPKPAAASRRAAAASTGFGAMWYKKTTSIGIRLKTGLKNQIFCFGGTRCREKSQRDMWAVGLKVLALLDNVMGHEDAKIEGQKLANALADE